MYPVTSRGRGGCVRRHRHRHRHRQRRQHLRQGRGVDEGVCCGTVRVLCGYGKCVVSGVIVRGYGRCGMSGIIRDGQCGSSTFGNYAVNFIQRLTKYIAGRRVNQRVNCCLFGEKFQNNASRKNRFHNEPENVVARRFEDLFSKHIKRLRHLNKFYILISHCNNAE